MAKKIDNLAYQMLRPALVKQGYNPPHIVHSEDNLRIESWAPHQIGLVHLLIMVAPNDVNIFKYQCGNFFSGGNGTWDIGMDQWLGIIAEVGKRPNLPPPADASVGNRDT